MKRLAAAGVLALILAGCGGASSPAAPTEPPTTPTTASGADFQTRVKACDDALTVASTNSKGAYTQVVAIVAAGASPASVAAQIRQEVSGVQEIIDHAAATCAKVTECPTASGPAVAWMRQFVAYLGGMAETLLGGTNTLTLPDGTMPMPECAVH